MSIKIYSSYEELKYEDPDLAEYLEDNQDYELDESNEELEESFFYNKKSSSISDDYSFYIISDIEDDDNADDIASYLGKVKKRDISDLHKILFLVN